MNRSITTCVVVFALSTSAAPSFAAQGSIIVRLDDGVPTRCIMPSDRLTAILRRAVIEKNSKWLGLVNDSEIGLTFTTRLSGVSGTENENAAFAKVTNQGLTNFSTGQISLSREVPLLSQLPLSTKENQYTTVEIEIGLVKAWRS